jgi:tetratricopeptide (TPR) repeat protein
MGAIAGRGTVLVWSGLTEEGIAALEMAQRIDPSLNSFNHLALALAYYLSGKYASAVELLARSLHDSREGYIMAQFSPRVMRSMVGARRHYARLR